MPKKVVEKISEEGIKQSDQNITKENNVTWSKSYRAEVIEIVKKTGLRGEATHVIVKVLDGENAGKILRRNVTGPIRVGDILMLRETDISAMLIEKKE